MVNIKGDFGGKNFALMVPNKKIIFHRISKLDFLGNSYSKKNSTTFQIEITYRDKSKIYTTGMGLVSLLLLLISFSLNFHLYYIVQNYKGIKEFYNTVKLEILNIIFMIIHFITIGFAVYTLYKLSLNK